MHSCSALPFSQRNLWLPGRRRTLNLQTHCRPCGRCPQGVRRAARSAGLQLRAILVPGLACLADVMRLHGSARRFSLTAISLATSKSSSRNMVTACNNSGICPVALARPPDSTKLLLAPQPRIASLPSARPQLLDGLQARCTTAQLIIILIGGIFRNTCAIIAILALARATIPLTSSSACSVIALASAPPLLGLLSLFTGFC